MCINFQSLILDSVQVKQAYLCSSEKAARREPVYIAIASYFEYS